MQKETGGGQSNGLGNLSNPAAQGEELTRAEWVDVVVTTSSDLVGPFRIADARTANGDRSKSPRRKRRASSTRLDSRPIGAERGSPASTSTRSLFAPTPPTVITPASVRPRAHPAESGRHSAIRVCRRFAWMREQVDAVVTQARQHQPEVLREWTTFASVLMVGTVPS